MSGYLVVGQSQSAGMIGDNQQFTSFSSDPQVAINAFVQKLKQITASRPRRETFPLLQAVLQLIRNLSANQIQSDRAITLLLLGYCSLPIRPIEPGIPGTPQFDPNWVTRTDEYALWKTLTTLYPDFVYNEDEGNRAAQGVIFAVDNQQMQPMMVVNPQGGYMAPSMMYPQQQQSGFGVAGGSGVPRIDSVYPNG